MTPMRETDPDGWKCAEKPTPDGLDIGREARSVNAPDAFGIPSSCRGRGWEVRAGGGTAVIPGEPEGRGKGTDPVALRSPGSPSPPATASPPAGDDKRSPVIPGGAQRRE